jgi:wyosine [tRNA(Phe)-imidazoG37] synthetase (radical SAM superfamily)
LTPRARIAVLSNATMLHKPDVISALLKVEDNIQKLDSGFEDTIRKMDCPASSFKLSEVFKNLKSFNGQVIIQTMFLRGTYQGEAIDNSTREEVEAWINLISEIKPSQVMIYTIDRDTPAAGLEKLKIGELQQIANKLQVLGFKVQVSG